MRFHARADHLTADNHVGVPRKLLKVHRAHDGAPLRGSLRRREHESEQTRKDDKQVT